MNRNIILIAILIIIVAIVGVFAFTQLQSNNDEGMLNTEINFLSEDTLKNGQAVEFELKDQNGQLLADQNITIIFVENGENQTYSIITDTFGKGSLVLNNEAPGSYDVNVSYNGSLKYYGCSAKKTITIEGEIEETSSSTESGSSAPVQSNSSAGTSLYNGNSSSQGELHYDSQYNFYYDDQGIIRGGQNDGMSAEYIKNAFESGDMIDEDGNLQ